MIRTLATLSPGLGVAPRAHAQVLIAGWDFQTTSNGGYALAKLTILMIPLLLFVIASLTCYGNSDAAAVKADINIVVDKARSVRTKGGDGFDDKQAKLSFDVIFENKSLSKPSGDLTATLYVVGVDVENKKKYRLLQKEEIAFALEPKKKHEAGTQPIDLTYDDRGYAQYGVKYRGWVVRIKDSEGNLVTEKASTSFLDSTEALEEMSVDSYFGPSGQEHNEP